MNITCNSDVGIYKVLLEHSHGCCWLRSHYTGRIQQLQQRLCDLQNWKYLLLDPHQKTFADPGLGCGCTTKRNVRENILFRILFVSRYERSNPMAEALIWRKQAEKVRFHHAALCVVFVSVPPPIAALQAAVILCHLHNLICILNAYPATTWTFFANKENGFYEAICRWKINSS